MRPSSGSLRPEKQNTDKNLTVIAYAGGCGLFLSPKTRREITPMSEANNSSWPFSELPEAEGLNFDKIFNQGSSAATSGDVNPFDANPFEAPQTEQPKPAPTAAATEESVQKTEASAPESEPQPAPEAPPAQPAMMPWYADRLCATC